MGFTKVGGKWISKDGDHDASTSAAVDLEQDELADMDVQHEDPPENYQMLDLVLVLEIRKMECQPCLLLKDTWSIGLIVLGRTKGIFMICV